MDIRKITAAAAKRNLSDIHAIQDYFECIRLLCDKDEQEAHRLNRDVRRLSARYAVEQGSADMMELNKRSLLFDAPVDFSAFLQYIEWNRPAEARFYIPRRKILRGVVDALQRLTDDNLDELFISMPPRVGKTTILMFFVTWIVGRNPEASNLYSAYSDVITNSFYRGVTEVINDPTTYLWHDVFPSAKLVDTNAKDETFNIDRKKRYPSLTCRSLYGTLNGACDCNGFLVSDDLIGGIEEAMNKDRLIAAWSKVDNNLIPRAKEKAKVLWCGTRWSMIDPAGLRMDLLENDDNFKNRRREVINIPALDENDNSNFEYGYGVGFSQDYYFQRRASFERNNDMPSWCAQYMGEPIERAGALFESSDLKYYNGILPDGAPDRIFMAVDPAFGGGDFVSAPVCFQYGDDVYIHDVVYSDEDKRITQPAIVSIIQKYGVQAAHFEANKSTASYKEWIEDALKKDGYRMNITNKAAANAQSKEIRIYDKAPEIREFYYLESGKRSKMYSQFMQNMLSFKLAGKNKHDDSVDSLAIAANMVNGTRQTVEIFKRPF